MPSRTVGTALGLQRMIAQDLAREARVDVGNAGRMPDRRQAGENKLEREEVGRKAGSPKLPTCYSASSARPPVSIVRAG